MWRYSSRFVVMHVSELREDFLIRPSSRHATVTCLYYIRNSNNDHADGVFSYPERAGTRVQRDKCARPVPRYNENYDPFKPANPDIPKTYSPYDDTVKVWADQNSRYRWQFPSRTDL